MTSFDWIQESSSIKTEGMGSLAIFLIPSPLFDLSRTYLVLGTIY